MARWVMSFHMEQFIEGRRVEPGAVFAGPVTTDRILGTTVKAGARCESLSPGRWTPVVTVDEHLVWEGEPAETRERADGAARHYVRASLRAAARNIFS